jgi:multidrug efflux pump subunit AcrB
VRLVAVYDRALVIALRHRLITLAVMIATICATFVLFMVIPKGFFPEEDTGMIIGIVEGDQGISPVGMMGRVEAVLEVVTLGDRHPGGIGAVVAASSAPWARRASLTRMSTMAHLHLHIIYEKGHRLRDF